MFVEAGAAGLGEGDGTQELAAQALAFFQRHEYSEALRVLETINQIRPNSPKVLHNISVTRYYQQGATQPERLMAELAQISQIGREQQNQEQRKTIPEPLDVEAGYTIYNQAVLLYHKGRLGEAIPLLERLVVFLDSLEELLGMRVCLLFLEIRLSLMQLDEAQKLIDLFEKTFAGLLSVEGRNDKSAVAGGNVGLDVFSEFRSNSAVDRDDPESDGEEEVPKAPSQSNDEEASTFGMALRAGGQPLREESVTEGNVKLILHLYKARLFLMNSAHIRLARREIKLALLINHQNVAAIFLKANSEYIRQNYKKAAKLLNSTQRRANENQSTFSGRYFANNIACVHHRVGNHNAASFYLFQDIKEMTKPDGVMSYNLGIELLLANKPKQAFDHLVLATASFPSRPSLWLRLAEANIAIHMINVQSKFDTAVIEVEGGGVVVTRPQAQSMSSPMTPNDLSPRPSLSFALHCLNKCLSLLQKAEKIAEGSTASLIHATQTSLAFVLLQIDQASVAMNVALAVIQDPIADIQRKLYAHLYLAEAQLELRQYDLSRDTLLRALDLVQAKSIADSDVITCLRINMAVAHCRSGAIDAAKQVLAPFIKTVIGEPSWLEAVKERRGLSNQPLQSFLPPIDSTSFVVTPNAGAFSRHVLLAFVYILLRKGSTKLAIATLKRNRGLLMAKV